MKSLIRKIVAKAGFSIVRVKKKTSSPLEGIDDFSEEDRAILNACRPFTMTSTARMATLLHATQHIIRNQIPGDIAECGVWRGGSMMIVANALVKAGDTGRTLYLFDTYEGMSEPTEVDRHSGETARDSLESTPKGTGIWCYASLEEVRKNLLSTGYPEEKIHFIKGKIEDTVPATLPDSLALLRLDTDWYESTKHELLHLFPALNSSGILIIDDYGYWEGARKAVDEYLGALPVHPYLHRIDGTGRLLVKD